MGPLSVSLLPFFVLAGIFAGMLAKTYLKSTFKQAVVMGMSVLLLLYASFWMLFAYFVHRSNLH